MPLGANKAAIFGVAGVSTGFLSWCLVSLADTTVLSESGRMLSETSPDYRGGHNSRCRCNECARTRVSLYQP